MRKRLLIVAAFVLPLTPLLLMLGLSLHDANTETNRVAQLQPSTFAQLRAARPGDQVLIEGTVSDQSPTVFESFVAYVLERHYADTDLSDHWQIEGQGASPFRIELPDGEVWISNQNYELRNPLSSSGGNLLRYQGVAVGDRVTVLGRVSQDAQGLAIAASLVGGGTRSEFIASQQQPASIFAVLLAGSLTLAALLGLALLLGRRTTHRSSPLAA